MSEPGSLDDSESKAAGALEENVYSPPPHNHGQSPPFKILTTLFERVQNERKFDKRRRAIEQWFKHYRDDVGNDMYDVLRLILPQKDRERAVYQVKEKNLAKLFIRAIPLGKNDPDSLRLLNWKRPTDENKTAGDFPSVLYDVLSKRSSVTNTSMSIVQVNESLDELAKAGGKMDKQMNCIQMLYNLCTPADQRWIVRIVLKDLLISVKETTVFSVFHPDAQALFNTCSDLKRVAYDLWDPSHLLNPEQKAVQLFRAFAPMLCKRPLDTIETTVKKMGGLEFFIEEKLDGERIQLHKRGNEYFYCSRKGKDYTFMYGKHVGEGSLTPYIHNKAFHPNAQELILDGEMLVYDPELDRYMPFGHLKTAALGKEKKAVVTASLQVKVFDILMINGKSLLDRSTASRKRNLENAITEVKGRLQLATVWKGKAAKDVRNRMDQVMESRGEGLVLKQPNAQYILNGRNEDWFKIKPEYLDNMGETIDVLVTGGKFGSGKRGGGVSTLICSVRDDSADNDDDDDEEPKYRTYVRIGSGLTFSDYLDIRQRPWKPYDPKHPPTWMQSASKGQEDKGDVFLEPKDSFILKVKAAEIIPTDQYHMGVTMRFPRSIGIRDDLDITDCATASEVMNALRTEKKRKLAASTSIASKKRKITKTRTKTTTFAHRLAPSDINEVETKSDLLSDMKFYILLEGKPTPPSVATERKHELERIIVANGGDFAAGYKHDISIFILYGGESKPAAVSMIMRGGQRDIIRPKWIIDSIKQDILLPLKKKYFFHATEGRQTDPDYDQSDSDDDAEEDVGINEGTGLNAVPADSGAEDEGGIDSSDEGTVKEEREVETDPESADEFDEDAIVIPSDEEDDSHGAEELGDSEPLEDSEMPLQSTAVMGETKEDMHYDTDNIFRHLCFYLDTPENARLNQLKVADGETSEDRFASIKDKIEVNGGKIVALDDPRLTHVVFDPDNTNRRLEIKRKTCRTQERYLISALWVEACIEDDTLVDERMWDA